MLYGEKDKLNCEWGNMNEYIILKRTENVVNYNTEEIYFLSCKMLKENVHTFITKRFHKLKNAKRNMPRYKKLIISEWMKVMKDDVISEYMLLCLFSNVTC